MYTSRTLERRQSSLKGFLPLLHDKKHDGGFSHENCSERMTSCSATFSFVAACMFLRHEGDESDYQPRPLLPFRFFLLDFMRIFKITNNKIEEKCWKHIKIIKIDWLR